MRLLPDARRAAGLLAFFWYVAFVVRTSFFVRGERHFVLFEDAMISMRYARNFARGAGLVWNPGETAIEGYTNLLWTLWMSVPHYLGLRTGLTSLFVMLTGIVILVTLGLLTAKVAEQLSAPRWAATAAAVIVWFSYPLVFWTLRGMEVGAVALALLGMVHVVFALETNASAFRAAAVGLIGAACLLVRFDSAPCVLSLLAYSVWRAPRSRRAIVAAVVVTIPVVALVGHLWFRHSFYHERLPNTAYLKLLHIPFLARLKRGAFTLLVVVGMQFAIPLAALVVSFGAAWRASETVQRSRLALLTFLVGLQNAYSVFVGGDAWEWFRFANRYTTVSIPLFVLVVAASVSKALGAETASPENPSVAAPRRFGKAVLLIGAFVLGLQAYARRFGEIGLGAGILYSGKVVVIGALLIGLGTVVLVSPARAARLSSWFWRAPGRPAAALLAMFFVGQLDAMVFWCRHNAPYFAEEAVAARLGLLIAATTPTRFRTAVVAAGATPYFAERPTDDMLGKSDAVIAKELPKLSFFAPGHDKWDYEYTLRTLHPDLVVEFPNDEETARYRDRIDVWGFEQLDNGLWLRRGALDSDRRRLLGSPYSEEAELDAVLVQSANVAERRP